MMPTATQLPQLPTRQLQLCRDTVRNRDIDLHRPTVLLGPGDRDLAAPGLER
jgi:hypothetical protein